MKFLKTVNELEAHLRTYKDAVIIVGNHILTKKDNEGNISSLLFQPSEDNKDIFNRRTMVKEPKAFWDFYQSIVLNNYGVEDIDAYKQIEELINTGLFKTVIDFNCDGLLKINNDIEYIPVKGNRYMLQCVKCKENINIKDINFDKSDILIHKNCSNSLCEGKIRPTVLFFNDKYEQDIISNIFKCIFKYDNNDNPIGLNTHTLFLIGVDYEENLVDEILEGFNKYKKYSNALSVFIEEGEDLMMCGYDADFGTTYEIDKAIKKLIDIMNKLQETRISLENNKE